ncbi:MAG: hypothetical protein OEV59_04635 [Deltaproteobacteria bacterium]|nr:hypothetical protein [Deltaproteobacteria bacterium]
MTIFTVIWFVVLLACGYIMSSFFAEPFIRIGMFVVGLLAPVGIYRLTLLIIDRCDLLPKCKNKRCSTKRYSLKDRTEEGVYYVCECGDVYLYTMEKHFKLVNKDGMTQPYRIKNGGLWWPAPEEFAKYLAK